VLARLLLAAWQPAVVASLLVVADCYSQSASAAAKNTFEQEHGPFSTERGVMTQIGKLNRCSCSMIYASEERISSLTLYSSSSNWANWAHFLIVSFLMKKGVCIDLKLRFRRKARPKFINARFRRVHPSKSNPFHRPHQHLQKLGR